MKNWLIQKEENIKLIIIKRVWQGLILNDKKITLTLSLESELKKISSSKKHSETFKRTVSRLYEMTLSKNSWF